VSPQAKNSPATSLAVRARQHWQHWQHCSSSDDRASSQQLPKASTASTPALLVAESRHGTANKGNVPATAHPLFSVLIIWSSAAPPQLCRALLAGQRFGEWWWSHGVRRPHLQSCRSKQQPQRRSEGELCAANKLYHTSTHNGGS